VKKERPIPKSFLSLLWRRYWYYLLVWAVLTAIVLYGYETQFDRERICTYQYCPSSFVLASCVGCIILGMLWVDFFFYVLRPFLRWHCGRLLGTRIRSDLKTQQSFVELLFTDGHKDFWTAGKNASVFKQLSVAVLDLLCLLLFLMLPIAGFLCAASGIAYLEQQSSPTPPGLIGLEKTT